MTVDAPQRAALNYCDSLYPPVGTNVGDHVDVGRLERALHELETAAAELDRILHVLHGLLVVSVPVCLRVRA